MVHCMGTVFSFDVRTSEIGAGALEDALDSAELLLHEADRTFSTYRSDSVVSRLNRGELDAADADDLTQQALGGCRYWQRVTDGWFTAYATGALDPSGYVKGWAIERASDLLREAGSRSHSINGGGDVQCVGMAAVDRPWQIGIADPSDSSRILRVVSGTDLAVATSGTAERGSHIIDPHTRQPVATLLRSLTVFGRSITACDVLATAGFAMGDRARSELGPLLQRAGAENGASYQAFAVQADGSTWTAG